MGGGAGCRAGCTRGCRAGRKAGEGARSAAPFDYRGARVPYSRRAGEAPQIIPRHYKAPKGTPMHHIALCPALKGPPQAEGCPAPTSKWAAALITHAPVSSSNRIPPTASICGRAGGGVECMVGWLSSLHQKGPGTLPASPAIRYSKAPQPTHPRIHRHHTLCALFQEKVPPQYISPPGTPLNTLPPLPLQRPPPPRPPTHTDTQKGAPRRRR